MERYYLFLAYWRIWSYQPLYKMAPTNASRVQHPNPNPTSGRHKWFCGIGKVYFGVNNVQFEIIMLDNQPTHTEVRKLVNCWHNKQVFRDWCFPISTRWASLSDIWCEFLIYYRDCDDTKRSIRMDDCPWRIPQLNQLSRTVSCCVLRDGLLLTPRILWNHRSNSITMTT